MSQHTPKDKSKQPALFPLWGAQELNSGCQVLVIRALVSASASPMS